jgi:hypothetical protein
MMIVRRSLMLFAACSLLAPLPYLVVARIWPTTDPLLMLAAFHFWVVSGTALAAAVACGVIVVSAKSLRETRLLFLALAFVCIAGVFAVHGLMTPGFMADELYASVPVSAWISVMLGAVFVALSALELPKFVQAFVHRAGTAMFAWTTVAVGLYILLSIEVEDWLRWVPTNDRFVQYLFAVVAFALFAFAAYRYFQAYLFARLPSQAAMVAALAMLCEVPVIMLWGTTWHFVVVDLSRPLRCIVRYVVRWLGDRGAALALPVCHR